MIALVTGCVSFFLAIGVVVLLWQGRRLSVLVSGFPALLPLVVGFVGYVLVFPEGDPEQLSGYLARLYGDTAAALSHLRWVGLATALPASVVLLGSAAVAFRGRKHWGAPLLALAVAMLALGVEGVFFLTSLHEQEPWYALRFPVGFFAALPAVFALMAGPPEEEGERDMSAAAAAGGMAYFLLIASFHTGYVAQREQFLFELLTEVSPDSLQTLRAAGTAVNIVGFGDGLITASFAAVIAALGLGVTWAAGHRDAILGLVYVWIGLFCLHGAAPTDALDDRTAEAWLELIPDGGLPESTAERTARIDTTVLIEDGLWMDGWEIDHGDLRRGAVQLAAPPGTLAGKVVEVLERTDSAEVLVRNGGRTASFDVTARKGPKPVRKDSVLDEDPPPPVTPLLALDVKGVVLVQDDGLVRYKDLPELVAKLKRYKALHPDQTEIWLGIAPETDWADVVAVIDAARFIEPEVYYRSADPLFPDPVVLLAP